MAATGNVREDGTFLSRLDRSLFKLEEVLNLLAGMVILAVMFLAVGNIVGRYFGYPVPGYVDYMEQAVPMVAVLGIAYCQRLGGHIRMDIVVGALKGRLLWFAELIGVLLMMIITIMLVYGSWDHASRAIRLGDSTVDINLPTWPTKLIFPIVFSVLAVRLAIHVLAYYKAMIEGETEPAAVPLIEDVATQTKREAETVSGLEGEVK